MQGCETPKNGSATVTITKLAKLPSNKCYNTGVHLKPKFLHAEAVSCHTTFVVKSLVCSLKLQE